MNEASLRTFCARLGINLSRFVSARGWIEAPCPLAPYLHEKHRDEHPSFAVCVNDTGVSSYKCYTCKNNGTFNKLASQIARFREDASIRAIANEIALQEVRGFTPPEWQDGVVVQKRTQREVSLNRDAYPLYLEYGPARAYLESRDISAHTALALGLRCDPDRGRVLFPVYDVRRVFRGYSGRAIELPSTPRTTVDQWLAREGGRRPKVRDYLGLPKHAYLLGEHKVRVRTGSRIILVEGLFAYARLEQLGIKNVVALLGSVPTAEKAQTLLRWNCAVVCLLDDDKAGMEGIYGYDTDAGHVKGVTDYLYGRVPLLIPTWPEGKDDPDQLTKAEIDRIIRTAEPYIE